MSGSIELKPVLITLEEALKLISDLQGERDYLWRNAQVGRLLKEMPPHIHLRRHPTMHQRWIASGMVVRVEDNDLIYVLENASARMNVMIEQGKVIPLPEDARVYRAAEAERKALGGK